MGVILAWPTVIPYVKMSPCHTPSNSLKDAVILNRVSIFFWVSLWDLLKSLYAWASHMAFPFVHNIIPWKVIPTLFVYFQIYKRCFWKPLLWSFNQWWSFSTHNLFPQNRVQFKFHHVTYYHLYFYIDVAKNPDFIEPDKCCSTLDSMSC